MESFLLNETGALRQCVFILHLQPTFVREEGSFDADGFEKVDHVFGVVSVREDDIGCSRTKGGQGANVYQTCSHFIELAELGSLIVGKKIGQSNRCQLSSLCDCCSKAIIAHFVMGLLYNFN